MWIGIFAGLAAGALWGLVFIAPQMLPTFSAVDVASGRFLSYGIFSCLVLLLGGSTQRRPNRTQLLEVLGLSILGFIAYYTWLALSVQLIGSALPALIIGTIPVWVMIFGKPQGLLWKALIPGLLLTIAGLCLMSYEVFNQLSLKNTQASGSFYLGVWWSVMATLSWIFYNLWNARLLKKYSDIPATQWTNWLGVATGFGALCLWLLLGSPIQTLAAVENPVLTIAVVAGTGVGSAWLATVVWNIASQRLSPSLCGQLIVSETLFALLFSFLWSGAWPSIWQSLAAILFVLGILASVKAHQ